MNRSQKRLGGGNLIASAVAHVVLALFIPVRQMLLFWRMHVSLAGKSFARTSRVEMRCGSCAREGSI